MNPESSTDPFPFSDPQFVARYTEGPPRFVPGFADLHRMVALLLAERAPRQARILVLGAGGGLELKSFAVAHSGWTFDGIDPAAEMLKLAATTLGPLVSRVRLHQGYIDDAPDGPFDGATCLLTLHFLAADERRRTLTQIHRRLKPGAPFIAVHASIPGDPRKRDRWLERYTAFAATSGVESGLAETARKRVRTNLNLLAPDQDEELLRAAGFSDIDLFYTGFTFRGWVGYA